MCQRRKLRTFSPDHCKAYGDARILELRWGKLQRNGTVKVIYVLASIPESVFVITVGV
jgi:hypothetical protein